MRVTFPGMNHTLHIGRSPKNGRNARRGLSLVYSTVTLGVLMGFSSFAVDFGRITASKTELLRAADAAARAGAANLNLGSATARAQAVAWTKVNKVDNRALADDCIAVTVGIWTESNNTFRGNLAVGETPNAVRVVLTRPAVGPNSVPLLWGSLIGTNGCQVRAEAIAEYIPGVNVNQKVEGTANPFLAGMPKGSTASEINPHNSKDVAGDENSSDLSKRKQSPQPVALDVKPGDVITFDEPAAGTVRHDPNLPFFDPDGELGDIGHNNLTTNGSNSYGSTYYSQNGLSDMRAPINALVGVFTGDDAPNKTATPNTLDFSSALSRDFSTLAPKNKQIFFIGDGANSAGMKQSFIVPPGATKLYLATWDFYEWNNNAGNRVIKITRPSNIRLVK